MGTVYRAEDLLIGRIIALKTIAKPGLMSAPQEHEAYARFLRESHAAGRLSHPNVVTVFDVGEDNAAGVSFIAMELVEGETLDRVVSERRALPFDEIRTIGREVAQALQAAHAAGVVHRDIKPANLIRTESGQVKVADFGIAKIANAEMTQDGSLIGSPSYMSPEQVRAAGVDHRSDLFSLGIVLWELATLERAFSGSNVFQVIAMVSRGELPPPSAMRPGVPPDLEEVILRATAPNRDDRFASAAEMALALGADPATAERRSPRAAAVRSPVPQPAAVEAAVTEAVKAEVPPEPEPEPVLAPAPSPAPLATVAPAEGRQRPSQDLRRALAAGALLLAVGGLGWGLARGRSQPVPVSTAAAPGTDTAPIAAPTLTGPPAAAADAAAKDQPAPSATPLRSRAKPRTETPVPALATASVAPAPAPAETVPAEPSVGLPMHVDHVHRLGSCRGTLYVSSGAIEYDSAERDADDVRVPWDAVSKLDVKRTELELTVEDGSGRSVRAKRYRFRFDERSLSAPIRNRLDAHAR